MIVAKRYEKRFKIVDGTQSKEKVIQDTIRVIKSVL
jgi:thymidylate kinase